MECHSAGVAAEVILRSVSRSSEEFEIESSHSDNHLYLCSKPRSFESDSHVCLNFQFNEDQFRITSPSQRRVQFQLRSIEAHNRNNVHSISVVVAMITHKSCYHSNLSIQYTNLHDI